MLRLSASRLMMMAMIFRFEVNYDYSECSTGEKKEAERAKVSDRSALLRIAASMLHNGNFPSPYPEDHPKRTPRRIIAAAGKAQDQLREWAVELAGIAQRMNAQPPSPTDKSSDPREETL